MAGIGEQSPLNPLYPVKPVKPPLRRERPKPVGDEAQRPPNRQPKKDEDDGKPHIDEYA